MKGCGKEVFFIYEHDDLITCVESRTKITGEVVEFLCEECSPTTISTEEKK